jgi:hypothetical protein
LKAFFLLRFGRLLQFIFNMILTIWRLEWVRAWEIIFIKCSSIPPVSCLERGFCVASAIIMLYHLQHEFEKMKMRVGPCKKKSALLPAFALCLLSVTACSALTPMQSISFSVGLGVFEIHGAQLLR